MTTTDKTEWAQVTLRLPPAQLAALREVYAQTYPAHRLSFNGWLVARVMREE